MGIVIKSMNPEKLLEFSKQYFNGELKNEYKIKEENHGSTYFYENQYIKVLHFKKHKFKNMLSKYIYKENIQLRNLKKISELCQKINIKIYNITGILSLEKDGFYYGFYSAEKVNGRLYHEIEKSLDIYRKAFSYYVKMLKNGIYEYDFGAHNFLITEDNDIIFIDFDEAKIEKINNKGLYKSLALLSKNFKRECEEYNLDWNIYKQEALTILEKELGIKKEKIEKRVKLLGKYRIFFKKFRYFKRNLKKVKAD